MQYRFIDTISRYRYIFSAYIDWSSLTLTHWPNPCVNGHTSNSPPKSTALDEFLSPCLLSLLWVLYARALLPGKDLGDEWGNIHHKHVFLLVFLQKINHFPGMSEICRKDLLARNMNRMQKLFPKDYNIFPKTWCLPAEWVFTFPWKIPWHLRPAKHCRCQGCACNCLAYLS